ncbi:RtcB family protein [Zobellella maritima]|uniref:RtcB family protein n=1 Tax=Zobellella maritima TaxID=2059725 RepID=UPI000E3064D2|nr:RtcB family protein [Zobellella maritima]
MPIKLELNTDPHSGLRPVKIFTGEVERSALEQLKKLAQLDIVYPHIAAMPDIHAGIGTTIGTVIPTRTAIIPAAVGVDIGCGMNAVRLSLTAAQLPDHLRPVRSVIEDAVPVGTEKHQGPSASPQIWHPLKTEIDRLFDRHNGLLRMMHRPEQTWIQQIGTLGGGNHFIELCLDEADNVWIMLHSGSRGIGNALGRYFIALARQEMQRHHIRLPDKDLAYLREGSRYFDDYFLAVDWAQRYAWINRQQMMELIIGAIRPLLPAFEVTEEAINCHHNYVAKEQHFNAELYVTRKGAISARKGQLGIIPGSMGGCSYIVRGKGNLDSFCSCSHGAGRSMSRKAARKRFSVSELRQQTQGVECRKDKHVIDEIPAAYKDINTVMANQNDLVEVVHTLKQVLCVKG